jgi:hypothetical protein
MADSPVGIAIQQIEKVKTECDDLLKRIIAFSPADKDGHYPDTFRLIATPMLYSVWERCFTLCHAITLRLIRDVTSTASALSAQQRAVWLLKSPFYNSLVDRLRNPGRPRDAAASVDMRPKTKKGEFIIMSEFLSQFDNWLLNGLDQAINTDDLVMKFSNVNPDVVELNARAIGITNFKKFGQLKLGQLNDLVGQRNDIGHGANIDPPTNNTFKGLLQFTEKLVEDYCTVFIEWIQSSFPDTQNTPYR